MATVTSTRSPQMTRDVAEMEKVDWWGMRSKPTQSWPKHSLFGTNMENVDKESLRDTKGHYIPEGYIRPQPERYPLPEDIKKAIPGRDTLETSRQNLVQQRNILCETDRAIRSKEEKALGFKDTGRPQATPAESQSSRPVWLSQQDLEHSKEINIVGLNEKGSFNRDKYGPKPRRHAYSLIGDVMAKNMDFNTTKQMDDAHVEALLQQKRVYGPGRHLPRDLMEEAQAMKPKKSSRSVIDLPPNIRHTFGSRVCDNLLSDQSIVSRAMERQEARSGPPRPSKKENVKGLPVNLNDNYESIGQATRYNVFPGLTTEHTMGLMKSDFNDDVHRRRVPCTDEYRYQRDELSTWSEHNVLRERMKKAWDEAQAALGGKKEGQ